MKITILSVGKCRDAAINGLTAEYLTRAGRTFPCDLLEIPQINLKSTTEVKKKEGAALLAKIPDRAFVVALDEKGKALSSRGLAEFIATRREAGTPLCFLIGGAEGLDEVVRRRADLVLSLSALTLPHFLVRPLLAEQLYRAASLLEGHPYHRD